MFLPESQYIWQELQSERNKTGQYYQAECIFNINDVHWPVSDTKNILLRNKTICSTCCRNACFLLKYPFDKPVQASELHFKKLPCAVCRRSINCLTMQFRTGSTRAPSYINKEEILTGYALNSKIHKSIGI